MASNGKRKPSPEVAAQAQQHFDLTARALVCLVNRYGEHMSRDDKDQLHRAHNYVVRVAANVTDLE